MKIFPKNNDQILHIMEMVAFGSLFLQVTFGSVHIRMSQFGFHSLCHVF